MNAKTKRPRGRGLPNYEGRHEGPMAYVVRLRQPVHEEAWLVGKNFSDGEVRQRLLCRVDGEGTAALRECARHCGTTARIPARCCNCGGAKIPARKHRTG